MELAPPRPGSWAQFMSNWRNIVKGGLRYLFRHPIAGPRVLGPRLNFALFKKSLDAPLETPEGMALLTNSELLVYTQVYVEQNIAHRPMLDELSCVYEEPLVIDVGYNCGFVTRWLSDYNFRLRFIGIEPLLQHVTRAQQLDSEVRNPPRVKVHHRAAWSNSDKTLKLSVGERVTTQGNEQETHYEIVRTLHVDGLEAGPVFLLKIDTDGSNVQVLEGARQTLKRSRWLLIEEEPGVREWLQTNLPKWPITRLTHNDIVLRNPCII